MLTGLATFEPLSHFGLAGQFLYPYASTSQEDPIFICFLRPALLMNSALLLSFGLEKILYI